MLVVLVSLTCLKDLMVVIEKVYEEIDNIIINIKAHYNIVMGDFNAKVGPGEIRETCTGSYGMGTRNRRGDMLVEFAEQTQI